MKHIQGRRNERGNVFFYIFVGVALFGALSFAISQGNRGSVQTLERDRDKLLASDIIEYGETIARAVAQIRLRGATPSQVSFAHDDLSGTYGTPGANPDFEVFDPTGGGVVLKTMDASLGVGVPTMLFTGHNEFIGAGTTAGTASSADLIMLVRDLRADVCKWVNVVVDIQEEGDAIPVDAQADFTLFDGTYAGAETLGDDDTEDRLRNHSSGCFRDTAANQYVFYRVLIAR
ncbi:hypothetical protein [Micavibrio aeruginosavorus]|uniref:hypothetical protein n=1 Tax=Micavibrio aeruginosavorus TaxID=349221 RepID=UPI003F4AA1D6